MPTNFSAIVARVNQAQPHLLQWNSHASCAEFLQRVCAEPEPRSERVGLLSKSAAENGYTFPNGTRTSHDVLCWPNGERVDIISSAGAHPAPGGASWQVIPPENWRPDNRYVDISGWPIFDSGTPHPGPVEPMIVGFGWFCWMRAWADWFSEAVENERWILGEINPKVYRVFLEISGPPWRDAGVPLDSTWDDRFKSMLDHVGGQGRFLHCTLLGGKEQTPTFDSIRRFHDRIIRNMDGRWPAVRSWEWANEWEVNGWTAAEVRAGGKDFSSKLPQPYKMSLSSPSLAHGAGGTNEDMQASADEIYGGDGSGATEMTIHTMRDGSKWSDPFSFNYLYPHLPKINNEPRRYGDGVTSPPQVALDVTRTKDAGWPLFIGHSEWCVWNGHLPQIYWNGLREITLVKNSPLMPEIARILKAAGSEPEMPIPPYDEGWITDVVRPAVTATYAEANHPLDDLYPVWIARTLYDHDAGMTKDASLDKHLAELRASLGLLPF